MKFLIFPLLLLTSTWVIGQTNPPEKVTKTVQITNSDKGLGHYDYDKRGNIIFGRNDGLNGPVTMLVCNEYDSLDRVVKTYFAHSNIGFSLQEVVYEKDLVKYYDVGSDEFPEATYKRAVLANIKTAPQFLAMEPIQQLSRGIQSLSRVERLDSNKNIIAEYHFDQNRDTASTNTYAYDAQNREILFRYGVGNLTGWSWDIYSIYNPQGDKIQSVRISQEGNRRDTSEVYFYTYDDAHHRMTERYENDGKFQNKTESQYDPQGNLIQEEFYEKEESKLDVRTTYKYDKFGNCIQKTTHDFRFGNKERVTVENVKIRYW